MSFFLQCVCVCVKHSFKRFVKPRTRSDKWWLLKKSFLTPPCLLSARQLTLKTMKDKPDCCLPSVPVPPQSPLLWRRAPIHHSLLHLTHPSAVRRSTSTCARSTAGFLLHPEQALAASLGWRGPCRLGRGWGREGGGGWQQMRCRRWPPTQLWTVLSCSLQIP